DGQASACRDEGDVWGGGARSHPGPLRLVLLGRSGSGKSTAGNIILGSKEFESCPESFTAITQECEKKKTLIEGRQVAVVDTPDWFNSEKTPDEVRAQISACVTLSSPGPHAFLFCVPLDMPAKTELQALGALESVFGLQAVQRHTLVLFTYADRLRESEKAGNDGVEAYIAHQRGDLLKIVEKCRDRFHILELDDGWRESHNVAELLEKVDQTVKEAGGQCYSCPAFQEAENRVRQRQVEIARERKGNKLEEERRGFPEHPGGSILFFLVFPSLFFHAAVATLHVQTPINTNIHIPPPPCSRKLVGHQ
uniref:AIG1-type G domain-containing protein n=1 Tax=Mola mola TaxID=94237 RepID=A0A3Q3WPT0_MOLML